jgi:hypothetical protein
MDNVLEFLKAMQKGIETQIGSLASKMDEDREEMLELRYCCVNKEIRHNIDIITTTTT